MLAGNPTDDIGASTIVERLNAHLEPAPIEEAPAPVEETAEVQAVSEETPELETVEEVVEVESEEPAGDESEESDGPQMSTTDFAEVLGIDHSAVDVDDEGSLIIRTKIDGVEGTAKFNDLLTSYQLRGHVDNQSREVAEAKKAVKAANEEAIQAKEAKLGELDNIINYHKQEIMAEFKQYTPEKMAELRQYDPAEYSAVIADYQAKMGKLNNSLQQVGQKRAELTDEQKAVMAETLRAEDEKMFTRIPGWDKRETADKEYNDVMEWAGKHYEGWGENPDTLKSIGKGVVIDVLRKAMLYDKMQSKQPAIKNKVVKAPKLVRAGATRKTVSSESKKIQQLRQNIKKSGGKRGTVAELLLATGKV